jgi:hypothetical protein
MIFPFDLLKEKVHELRIHAENDGEPGNGDGYAAKLNLFAASGKKLGTVATDAIHNHMGIYTRKHPIEEGSGKMSKRVNIEGGHVSEVADEVLSDTYIRIFGEHDNILRQSAENGGIAAHDYISGGRVIYRSMFDPEARSWVVKNFVDDVEMLRANVDTGEVAGVVSERSGPCEQPGSLAFDKETGHLYYTDEDGDTHAFRDVGDPKK